MLINLNSNQAKFETRHLSLFSTCFSLSRFALNSNRLIARVTGLLACHITATRQTLDIFNMRTNLNITCKCLGHINTPKSAYLTSRKTRLTIGLPRRVIRSTRIHFNVNRLTRHTFLTLTILRSTNNLFSRHAITKQINLRGHVRSSLTCSRVRLLTGANVKRRFLGIRRATLQTISHMFKTTITRSNTKCNSFHMVSVRHIVKVVSNRTRLYATW